MPHPSSGTLTLPSNLENLGAMIRFIADQARLHGLDPKPCHEIELACDEILTNIMNYAYPESRGEISVRCGGDRRVFRVRISDSGIPFNPLKTRKPHLAGSIEERQIGGLGIFLARHLVDDIQYQRKKNRNVLTLYKKKGKPNKP